MTGPESDHDLLQKLIQKFDMFYDEFRRVSNGTGFPRCAERLARLEAVEEEVKSLKSKLWWALGLIVTEGVGLITAYLKGGFRN